MSNIKHVLFVDGFGDFLGLSAERLILKRKEDELEFPLDELEAVVITRAKGGLSTELMMELASRGIGLSVLNKDGRSASMLSPRPTHHVQLSAKQHRWREDGQGRDIAHRCIVDKISFQKQITELMSLRRRFKGLTQINQRTIQRSLRSITRCMTELRHGTLPERGYEDRLFQLEARAAKAYWSAVSAWLPPDYGFDQRRNRGENPEAFNAALNYGYAILSTRLTHQLAGYGFDPHLGCLHANRGDRPSLTFDLMERYRQRFVDLPLMRHALSRTSWELDENGWLDRSARAEISQVILKALDPRSTLGISLIQSDIGQLRHSLLNQSAWHPTRHLRRGLSPLPQSAGMGVGEYQDDEVSR